MDGTNFSSKIQESTAHTSQPTRRILAFPAKTRPAANINEAEFPPQNFLLHTSFSSPRQHDNDANGKDVAAGRERLKRHREEVAGQVIIPENWNQESYLMDWIDYSSFDKLLAPSGIASAREALMAEGRRASSQRLRIESRC